jgi:hypothetical protein
METEATTKNNSMKKQRAESGLSDDEEEIKLVTWKELNITELYPWMMENKFDNRQIFY